MSIERPKLDAHDEVELQRARESLARILEKYGPHVLTDAFTELLKEHFRRGSSAQTEVRCSFCGKTSSEVAGRLVQGPKVYICITCIDRCHQIRVQWSDHK